MGKNCFIAGPSLIMPGVKVGDGCIIGPMSVVYKDLPKETVYTPYRDMLFQTNEVKSLRKEVDFLKDQLKKIKVIITITCTPVE